MSQVPSDLKYTDTHEWVSLSHDGIATVGITDHAQEQLGDIVHVELPEVGSTVSASDEIAVVESVKAASDVYAPVAGEIVAANSDLEDSPESVNNDPYGDGWFFRVRVSDPDEVAKLLSADDYTGQCAEAEDD